MISVYFYRIIIISLVTFRDKINNCKTFLEYSDIKLTPRKFTLKVKFPKPLSRYKEAIDKKKISRTKKMIIKQNIR